MLTLGERELERGGIHLWGVQKQGFMYPEAERVVSDRSYHEVTIQYFVQWLIWSGAKGDTRQNG